MILKKPTFLLIVLSLVLTLVLAVPQTALAVPPPPECPSGTSLIAKYEWYDGIGYVFDKYYDIISITGDASGGTWDSGDVNILAVYIKDGHTPDGELIDWMYTYPPPGVTNGTFSAADMTPPPEPGKPPHQISHIDFCGDIFPISLSSINAQANRGTVSIEWVTATEINTAGFFVYRSTTRAGPQVQVTANLIAAQGDGVTGANYSVTDSPGYGTFYYWLEDVDYSGQSSLHGPVVVNVLSPIRLPAYRPSLPGQ